MWVLPAVLAALCLSIPAQLVLADRIGEPYPGLFQPAFRGVSQTGDHSVTFPSVRLWADGRRITSSDLVTSNDELARLKSLFPPREDRARVDDSLRRALRENLERSLGFGPRELVVTWQRRRFDLDTGQITRLRTLATYRLDLREEQR